jgi:uncharacterized protein (TIGR02145 family)
MSLLLIAISFGSNQAFGQSGDAIQNSWTSPTGKVFLPGDTLPGGYYTIIEGDTIWPVVPDLTAEIHKHTETSERGDKMVSVWNSTTRLWNPPVLEGETDLPNTFSNCTNSDFSQGTYNMWQGCFGSWLSSGAKPYNPPCNNTGMPWSNNPTGGNYLIIPSPGAPDSYVPAINTVFPGEAYSSRIGNHAVGGSPGRKIDQLTYQMTMGPDNQFITYRYAVVLASPGSGAGHDGPNNRPRFTIEIADHATGAVLDSTCGFFDIYPSSTTNTWDSINTYGWLLYKNWTTVGIDLSGMTTVGQVVDIIFRVHGCTPSGHSAWAYINVSCESMTVALAGCEGSGQITFTGPPGFANYEWQGPYCASCPTPPPIYTGQSVTITTAQGAVSGNVFHLNLTAANGCMVTNVQQVVGFTSVNAAFTPNVSCAQNVSSFTDNSVSTNATQPVINRRWKFEATGVWTGLLTSPTTTYTYATPGTYEVTVESYSQDGCMGTTSQMVVISPAPHITNTDTIQSICSGNSLNIPLTFSPGDSATWTSSVSLGSATVVHVPASQSGNLLADQITNTGTTNALVKYSMVPRTGTCLGPPVNFFITVKPTPHLTNPAPAPICSGDAFTKTLTPDVAGTNFTWTASCSPVGAVTGFTAAQALPATSIGDVLTNTTPNTATVTYHITPHADGCDGPDSNYTVTVRPHSVITSASTANWCNGVANTYNITTSTTTPVPTFAWSRASVPGITPATGSGTGATITETLVNSTTEPVVVTYVITPSAASCVGTAQSVAVTVNPTSVITSPGTANWCNNVSNTYNITSSSTTPTPSYAWTRAAVAGITNPAGSGTGASITETLENTTPDPISVNYVITPTVNGCTGTSKTVAVKVNPTAVITSASTANWCSSVANTYSITSSSTTPTPSYAWTRAAVAGITNPAGSGTGASITETLVNSTTDPIVVTYVITPSVNSCNGTPLTLTVTVNPIAVITSASAANWCNNVSYTYNITSSSTTPVPVFSWSRAAVAGITNPAGSGTGNSITETLVNSTTNPILVNYIILPTVNGCAGTQKTLVVTVNPTAVITSAGTANWCNNVSNTYTITSSTTPTPAYAWSRAEVPGISNLAASGIGGSITETLVNTTTDPVVVTYLITPTINGCDGTQRSVNVTVNPTAVITSPGTVNWCSSVPNTYNITSSSTAPAPSYTWSRAAVAGIAPATGSGTGNAITETLVNSTTDPIQVTYVISLNVNGCPGTQKNVVVTVNPISVITSPGTANWCNNVSNTYNITSSSTTPTPSYAWTRAAVAGITNPAGSGTGDAITETLENTTPDPITVNYVITPTVNGCTGTSKTVAVKVNPTAVITSASTANWCSSVANTYSITSSSTTPTPSYAWTRAAVAGITNPAGSGTGASITETLVNATTDPIVVTYVITPSVNSCNGTPLTLTVTVNPIAVITSASTANWCNNVSYTYNITSSSTTPVPVFSWSRAAVAGITNPAGSGTGNSITETLVNSTTNPILVNYIILPTVNGCAGTQKTLAVTVNPTAVITSAGTANWCNNVSNTYTITSSTTPTPAYAWSRAEVPGISNLAGSGTGGSITETLVNTTTDPVVVTYLITPTINGCDGTQHSVNVTVNPTAVITSPGTVNWCSSVPNTYNITSSSTAPAPSYTWSRAAVAGIAPATGSGTGNAITETLVNSTTDPIQVTYVISLNVNGCPGTQKNVVVTVNPISVITSPGTANWCNNVSNTYNITSSSTAPTPSYAWTRAAVAGITNPAGSGTGAAITETLENTTPDPITVNYVITPTVNGCTGTSKTVAVTVNPTSVITSPLTDSWCNNELNTYFITSTSTTPAPTYAWSRAAVTGITPVSNSGTGANITESLANSTNAPIDVIYVITPSVNGCAGNQQNVTVTVNPFAYVNSPSTANWGNNVPNTYTITSSCNNPVPVFAWSRAAVPGITPVTNSGSGPIITETLNNSTTDPIVVHYTIDVSVSGCAGSTFDLYVTVNPTSSITSPMTANWCNNLSNTYNITSSTTPTPDYTWSRAAVAGITNPAAAGTGATITETLVNTTTNPVVVTYVITPYVGGFPGTAAFVAVTVNPTSVVTSPTTANWCNSIANTYLVTSSSITPPPDYVWTRAAVPGIMPATGAGTGSSITETLTNSTTEPIQVNYVITPSVNSCGGTPKTITVTVNPTSVITSPDAANWCNNVSNTYNVTSSSASPTPTYTWTRASVAGITPATGSGSGAAITETLSNSTTNPIQVAYVITPTVNSCNGTPKTVTVTVNPTAVITSPATANWCHNTSSSYNITSSTTPTPVFTWSRASVPGITPATGTGTGATITETLLNATTEPIIVTYQVTPTINGCTGTAYPVAVTVNPNSVITSPSTANWCNNVVNTYNITSSSSAPVPSFAWSRASVTGITPVTGSGSGASITETLTNSTTDPVVVTYLITPTVNGCAGITKSVLVTVNPTSVITSPDAVSWCNNIANTYNITSSSSTPTPSYAWSRAAVPGITPATGSGSGAAITETLVNSTTSPVVVTYVITPTVNSCNGTVKNVSVTVNPTPHLMNAAPAPICSGTTFNVALQPDVSGGNFTWTASCSPPGAITGFTLAQPTGVTAISDVLTNTITTVATVTYAITPHANNCLGAVTYFSVNVNPVPHISCSAGQSICSGTTTTAIALSSTVAGTDYSWSATCPVGSVNPCPVTPGTVNPITPVTFMNVTNTQQTVNYTITSSFSGCPGTTATHAVTVNPSATVINWPLDQTICSGGTSGLVNLSSNVVGTTFSWSASTTSPISGFTASGTSTIPAQNLFIPPGNTGFVTYHIIPTFSGGATCPGAPTDYKINVNPLPTPSISGSTLVCELGAGVVYTTPSVPGHSYSWNVTGATNVANANTNSVTVTWGPYNFSPGTLTVTETIDATGCPQTSSLYSVTLQQRPVPTLTGPQTVCDQSPGKVYQTESGMANYTWTISGGSITSGGATGSPTATVTWNTPGSQWIEVNYVNSLGCPGYPAKQIPVTVNSLPITAITEGAGPNCESATHSYNVPSDPLCSYAWSILPASLGAITSGQGTYSVNIDWLSFGSVTLGVTGTNNTTTCVSSSTHLVTVHPKPLPTFTPCFDLLTTPNTRKFTLRGASPNLATQGVFTGTRVNFNALTGNYEFDPFGAPVGAYPVTYTYTNTFGCSSSAGPVTINVQNSSFSCGGILTDMRDGKEYTTAVIGGRCWMTRNLAFGLATDPQTQPQTDNCINEKYCLISDPVCTKYGGLYQWDELMRYASTSANQGICPPEWHVPSEAEWQSLINNVATWVTPADALAGSNLKDLLANPGFYALLDGIYYVNNTWSFTTGSLTATMYWTSTASGAERALARGVNVYDPSVSRYNGSRGNAFPVRCIKDTP